MREVGEHAELALELIDLLDVGTDDRLERDLLSALLVLGLVHDAHAAGADSTQDLIPLGRVRSLDHPLCSTISPATEASRGLAHRVNNGTDAVAETDR